MIFQSQRLPGITEQNAKNALVLQLCLREIQRSDLFGVLALQTVNSCPTFVFLPFVCSCQTLYFILFLQLGSTACGTAGTHRRAKRTNFWSEISTSPAKYVA
jgi:hypothetical protein